MSTALKPIDLDKNVVISQIKKNADSVRREYTGPDSTKTAEERGRFAIYDSLTIVPSYSHLEIYILIDGFYTAACDRGFTYTLEYRYNDPTDPFKYDVPELLKTVLIRNLICLMVLVSRFYQSDANLGLMYRELYDLLERNNGNDFHTASIYNVILNSLDNNDIISEQYLTDLINGNTIMDIATTYFKISTEKDILVKRLNQWLTSPDPPSPTAYIFNGPEIESSESKMM